MLSVKIIVIKPKPQNKALVMVESIEYRSKFRESLIIKYIKYEEKTFSKE
jgi:hypothetical protein